MRTTLLVTAAGVMLLAVSAGAQNTSDLMPALPKAPPGYTQPLYPGQMLPAPPAAGISTPGSFSRKRGVDGDSLPGNEKPAPTGRYVYDDLPGSDENSEVTGPADLQNGTYAVRKGDTLWGISSQYFRSPYQWPKLWAMNPSITNPHWIYPGDLLRLQAGAALPIAAPQPKSVGKNIEAPPPVPTGVFLRQTGFVEPNELKASGRIIGSKEEKNLLATLDEAYVEYSKDQPLEIGQRYTVYKPIKTIRHPVTGKIMGDLVQIYGEAEVKSLTQARVARILVVDSLDPIERGFRVGPLRRQFKIVEPLTGARDISGVVFATLQPVNLVAAETLVFMDRGRKDGVEVGNRMQIVRRGDGFVPILAKGPVDDRRFPRETIAEILVIDLRDAISTGIVTKGVKEARVGDRVEGKKGL